MWKRVAWANGVPARDGDRRSLSAALTAAQAGLVSCETCGLLSRPADPATHRVLPALRRARSPGAASAPSSTRGPLHRRGDLLRPGQRPARCYDDRARVDRVRHHPGRRDPPVAHRIVAARAHRAGRQRDGSAGQDRRARLPPRHRAARLARSNRERTRLYRMVEFIGRWSMLDVFVDTFTVALVQLQPLMSVEPGPGVVFFAAVVVLTMLAAESFDPRLIWDPTAPAGSTMAETATARASRGHRGAAAAARASRSSGSSRSSPRWSALGIAVQRILSEGPTITIIFKVCRGHRGRQDLDQVQGRGHRPGDGGALSPTTTEGGGHRARSPRARRT